MSSTYTASGIGIALDAATVLAVNNLRVLESNSINGVVALSTDGANAETVATRAVHVVNNNLSSTGNCNTVILVVNLDILQGNVVTGRDIESVAVVGCSLAAASRVRLVPCGVVQNETGEDDVLASSDAEAVNGPVHDVQVGDLGVVGLLNDEEVVRPGHIS
jgi:hypothetical protein